VISHGLPIYVALEPVDMRLGIERLGGVVRERMRAEPRSRALFVFVGKSGHSMKALTWDGTGMILITTNSLHTAPPVVAREVFARGCRICFGRSTNRFQRLHCLMGALGPGRSYRNA
jgi:IS66 Orf2 like protein